MTQSRHACASLLLASLLTPCALAGASVVPSDDAGGAAVSSFAAAAEASVAAAAEAAPEHLPRVLARDLPLLDRVLGLDAAQRPIVEALLQDVELEAGTGPASRATLVAFRENLLAVLTDGQRARIGEAWAAVYRERMESAGAIGGEGVDLAALARAAMRGEVVEPVEAAVARYRSELDPLLDARIAAEAADAAALRQVRIQIRALNDRSVESFAGALPPAIAADFRREVARKSYPTAVAPSAAFGSLDLVLVELPTDALRVLRAEAAERYDALCRRGIAAVRARDDAGPPGEGGDAAEPARAAAAKQIEEAERAYDAFESWLNGRIVECATAEALGATRAGRAVLETVRQLGQGADHRWTDRAATVQRFDTDGDGAVQGNEATSALEAFARSVGRQQRRRL